MGKKPSAIYAPGELDKVRGKLGEIDADEARRMAKLLGGEVGVEKDVLFPAPVKKPASRARRETVDLAIPGRKKSRSVRAVDIADLDDLDSIAARPDYPEAKSNGPADDPSVKLRTSYFERLKMDRYAAQFEFEIKNSLQVLIATLSFFSEPEDYVNPRFVSRRMNAYYAKIERLVSATRGLFPRNNARRSERLKKASPFVYSILDTIRHWNVERIDSDLVKIQSHPRSVKVSEFTEILRVIYKPLFILEKLDMDIHIKGAYKLLYKLIYVENPSEPKEKNQDLIRIALSSINDIRREVQFGMYPLIMKLISDRWLPYEKLFIERHYRFMAFIGATENDQINPITMSLDAYENESLEAVHDDVMKEQESAEHDGTDANEQEDKNDPAVIERKMKTAAAAAEKKAYDQSVNALEALFPQAGWDRLQEFPDLYPYFVNPYGLRRGYELIAPEDPLQQIAVLMHIMEDLCVGLRYVTFGSVVGPDGKLVNVNEMIGKTITNWRQYIDDSFTKDYLPRLTEYCRILEHSSETRTSPYARRTLNELRWTKRLYFLPYYKFESLGPPPFQKQDIVAIYNEIRTLRKYLTLVATGIESGNRNGGAAVKAHCDGIDNPWDKYNFEIPNPVSKRLDALLGSGKKNNAVLVFFALSVMTILDNLVNGESSWAYTDRPGALFRSISGAGVVPMFGIDHKVDADQIFKDTIKRKESERQKNKG